MREFRKGELATLSWGTRVVYTAFLAFSFASYAVMAVIAVKRAGITPASMSTYYVGDEAHGIYGKAVGELLELTHFHLFSIPLFLLVQGHIFILGSWKPRVKVAVVAASFFGAALYIAGPWLIVGVSPQLAALGMLGRVILAVCFTLFFVVPLRDMWAGSNGQKG